MVFKRGLFHRNICDPIATQDIFVSATPDLPRVRHYFWLCSKLDDFFLLAEKVMKEKSVC